MGRSASSLIAPWSRRPIIRLPLGRDHRHADLLVLEQLQLGLVARPIAVGVRRVEGPVVVALAQLHDYL